MIVGGLLVDENIPPPPSSQCFVTNVVYYIYLCMTFTIPK